MKRPSDFAVRVGKSIRASVSVKQSLLRDQKTVASIAQVCQILITALRSGGKVLFFGNGGSASDAQHMAAELVGRFNFDRPALPAIALTANSSSLTAIANDLGYHRIFARQIEALARPGDIAVGISTSGNSPNVVAGLRAAKKIGLTTIALTGQSKGKLGGLVDHFICAPSSDTPRIQECHGLVGHIISQIIEQELFHEKSRLPRS